MLCVEKRTWLRKKNQSGVWIAARQAVQRERNSNSNFMWVWVQRGWLIRLTLFCDNPPPAILKGRELSTATFLVDVCIISTLQLLWCFHHTTYLFPFVRCLFHNRIDFDCGYREKDRAINETTPAIPGPDRAASGYIVTFMLPMHKKLA